MATTTRDFHASVLKANEAYAADFGAKAGLALPPSKRAAVLICMDARIDPAKALGLAEGDAHVIRNAGGRASDDALRSLVISNKLLATQEIYVVHHTDCGMLYFTNGVISELLKTSLAPADIVVNDGKVGFVNAKQEGGSAEGTFVNFLTIADEVQAVKDDVARIRGYPLISGSVPIHGYIYSVTTGKVAHVVSA